MSEEPNLEDMIRAAVAHGELTHLSVFPIAGKGPNGVLWSASYSPATKWGAGFGRDADPIKAMKMALTDKKLGALVTQMRKSLEGSKTPGAREAIQDLDDSDFVR